MGKITINTDSLKTRREWKRHKIKDGSNVYRFLPPFGDIEVHNNYPYRKWSTVWLVDPKTGTRRPFASPLTDGNQNCPVREYNDKLTKHIDKLKAHYEQKGLSEDKIKTKLKNIREVQWNLKVQNTYAYNATDKSGEVGILELKSTAHQGVKKMMNQYIKDYGQDPTSLCSDLKNDSGVWFNITKEGDGKNTVYSVDYNVIKRKNADGELEKKDDRSPLSDNIAENYDDLGYDLNSIYVRKTSEELMEILLYNLAMISESCPEAILPGYDVSGISVNKQSSDDDDDSDDSDDTEDEEPVVNNRSSKPSVVLNLDDDSDEIEDEEPVVRKTTKLTQKTKNKNDTDDIFAMAESILGD